MKKATRTGLSEASTAPGREHLLLSRRDLLAVALPVVAVAHRSATYEGESPPLGGGPVSPYEYAYVYAFE
jgi:hypothetical protein